MIVVLVTNNVEGYEGSQTQLGICKDGTIRWEYQSHCSCNSYEDSEGDGEIFCTKTMEKKDFELEGIPLNWQEKVEENIKKLLSL